MAKSAARAAAAAGSALPTRSEGRAGGSEGFGCEAAEYLAERGHQVAIVEMKDVIAADVTPENRRYMFRNFGENHVLLQPGAKAPGNAVLATGDALEAALAI